MTHTIEVLQEDIDNAVNAITKNRFFLVCKECIITQALNRTFKGELFEVGFAHALSDIRKLILSDNVIKVTHLIETEWRAVKPFTFTATEY